MPLKIVSGQTWGKVQAKWRVPSVGPSEYVFFVNSNTRPCFDGFLCIGQAKYIHNLHTKRSSSGCPDVRFNFMIGGDGNVYEGRGWNVRPALPRRHNRLNGISLLVAFIGTFLGGNKVVFVTGKEWRRHDPVQALLQPMACPVASVVVGYTLKDPCFDHQECKREIKWTQKCHIFGRSLGDIRYNFLIGGDASVYECRSWNIKPSIPDKFQLDVDDCIYVAFMGRFDDEPPTEEMIGTYRWLLEYGVEHKYLSKDYNEIFLDKTGNSATNVSSVLRGNGNTSFQHKYVNR